MARHSIRAAALPTALAPLFALLLLAGCGDPDPVTGPATPESPSFSSADPPPDDVDGFHWLPPVADDPDAGGDFDPALAPRVEICRWDDGCAAAVAHFSMTEGKGSERIRVDERDEHYIVNWHTNRFDLDPDHTYRVRVLVDEARNGDAVLLGHVDVRVVRRGRDLQDVDPDRYVGIVNGQTLPLRFRIETGIAGSLTVDPAAAEIEVGETQAFTATLHDLHGADLPGADPAWSSLDPGVAPVDGDGVAEGLRAGTTTITAAWGGVTGDADLTVVAPSEPECGATVLCPGMNPVAVEAGPGQPETVAFHGSAGQRVSILVEHLAAYCATYTLRAPDGDVVVEAFRCGDHFTDLLVLEDTGEHRLEMVPHQDASIHARVNIWEVPPDVRIETAIGGGPTVADVTTPAQNAYVTFDGRDGERVSVHVARTFGCATYVLRGPSDDVLWQRFDCGNPFSDLLVLPETGAWTLFIDPHRAGTGQASVTVREVPPDARVETAIDGDPATVAIDAPAQNATVRFDGAAGQPITVVVQRSWACARYTLRAPDGAGVWSTFSCGTAYSDARELAADGRYTLAIDPHLATTGTGTVHVRSVPPDAEGTAIVGGDRVDLAITAPGQHASVRFDAPAGQEVTVHSDRVSGGCARYTLLGPDDAVIGGVHRVLRCGAFSTTLVIPASGTQRLLIEPHLTWTGLTRTTIGEP